MPHSESTEKEPIVGSLIEDITQMYSAALGEEPLICPQCGNEVQDGVECAVYAYRACNRPAWRLGQVTCIDHPPDLDSLATPGVRDMVITGRVGRCMDQARQATWLVLLNPTVQAVASCDR